MDSGQFAWLRHQQLQKGFEQAFTPDPDVVHELKDDLAIFLWTPGSLSGLPILEIPG